MTSTSRPPICSVVGHVDAGKTRLLDRLRNTNIGGGEVGGITQRIGVTKFPKDTIVKIIGNDVKKKLDLPGLLLIDTPGHDCFTNQRMCGIKISDIVVVVVDIFKGLEPQTVECFELLKKAKTPFIIVANKIDRISHWVQAKSEYDNFKQSLNRQTKDVKSTVMSLIKNIELQCAEAGYNAKYYLQNRKPKEFISIIPASAMSGEGIPDLLMMIDVLSGKFLQKQLRSSSTFTAGYVVEKIKHKKFGDLVTCILTDGKLATKSDLLLLDSYNQVFESKLKYIFQPDDSKEVKDKLVLKSVDSAASGSSILIKLGAPKHLSVGSKFYVFANDKEKQHYQKKLLREEQYQETNLDRDFVEKGVYLTAPSIGTMTALLNICDSNDIPVSGINIGTVTKVDILKAKYQLKQTSSQDDKLYYQKYSAILDYGNEPIDKELVELAKKEAVEIFADNIIYNLVDQYQKFKESIHDQIRAAHPSIVPKARLQILEQYVFIKKDPILVGVKVLANKITKGVVIETTNRNKQLVLGTILSIQKDNKPVEQAEQGDEVCIKIIPINKKYEYGRDFNFNNILETHYSDNDMLVADKYPLVFNF